MKGHVDELARGRNARSANAAQYFARLRSEIARGATLREVSQALQAEGHTGGTSVATLSRLAKRAGLKPSGKLPPAKERKILRHIARDEATRVIARLVEVSTATVHRRKQRRLARFAGKGPKVVAKYTCGGCGYDVVYDPCQICRARQGGT